MSCISIFLLTTSGFTTRNMFDLSVQADQMTVMAFIRSIRFIEMRFFQ
jgi:hypothetical protein